MKNLLFGALLLVCGCATVTPAQRAAAHKIPVVMGNPPAGCEDLGMVTGRGWNADDSREEARINAATKGANLLRIDRWVNIDLIATAFRCSETASALSTPL